MAILLRFSGNRRHVLFLLVGGAIIVLFLLSRSPVFGSSGRVFQNAPVIPAHISSPPRYERLRKWEDELPQHDLDLPFPEGRTGRYIKFSNQIKSLGWNNVMNEVLMNAHLAYVSRRAYVFQDYVWKPEYYAWPEEQMHEWPPRTPLNALMAGPATGLPWGEDDTAPRSISEKWFDVVCPKDERRIINTRDVKPAVWNSPGADVLAHWAKVIREAPERCLEIEGASHDEDNFSQTFDLWIFGSTRVLSLWDSFSKSPVSTLLATSPIVKSAVDANELIFLPRGRRPMPSYSRDPYERMMAMHVRRGDFFEACQRLAYYNSTFYSWNLLPSLPDPLVIDPKLAWNTTQYIDAFNKRCLPEIAAIAQKARTSREAYANAARAAERRRNLDVMYLLTNEKGPWLQQMKDALKNDGWNTIVTSSDLVLNDEQMDVNMAVDMEIARKAAVFIGNGWSSFTSNIIHRRLVDGKAPISIRFW